MAWGADQALQPHEVVWALRRFVSRTGQESALPPYAPASRADRATRTGCGTTWGWSAGAGLRHHWLLRPLTSLGRLVPGCRRGWTQIPSACVSWPGAALNTEWMHAASAASAMPCSDRRP